MQTFYHGSSALFTKFNIAHVLTGSAKCKFGYGIYVSTCFLTCAHYAGANKDADTHYVYTVETPKFTDTNHITFKRPVNPAIITRAEEQLGFSIPEKYTLDGKDFRKFLAKHFEKHICIDLAAGHSLKDALHLAGEQAASEFLISIGVDFITWPYSWKNPALGTNVCVLDENNIKIIKVEQVELDAKQQLIAGSEREVQI